MTHPFFVRKPFGRGRFPNATSTIQKITEMKSKAPVPLGGRRRGANYSAAIWSARAGPSSSSPSALALALSTSMRSLMRSFCCLMAAHKLET